MSKFPVIVSIKYLHDNVVSMVLRDGRIFVKALPVESAKRVRIVARGTGIDLGNGQDGDSMWAIRGAKLVGRVPGKDPGTRAASPARRKRA